MYRCSNCGATMSQPLDRCPSCRVLLSGVKCEACKYVGGKTEFINNGHRCPKCNSTVYVPGEYAPHVTPPKPPVIIAPSDKSPITAALLSFFLLGGAGQIYVGQSKKGWAMILATLTLNFCVPFIGIPMGIVCVSDAYGTAQKLSDGNSVEEWEFNLNWKVAGLVTIIYAAVIGGIVFISMFYKPS